ncbi:MAG: LptF/LptG family permease, partial [Prevotella sp.]|nr:LptF/LptG family permease [Prevotella sp.]
MKYSKTKKYFKLLCMLRWLRKNTKWLAKLLNYINPFNYIKKIDRYIIGKFIGTYFYSIILIISISIVFDVNENLAKFTTNNAPLRAIVFDYYANFVPYFANLFSPLFVFIAVIFFTSKLAGNSEVIAMLASGMSFKRLIRPYMISAAFIAGLNFYLGAYIIPQGTVVRHN